MSESNIYGRRRNREKSYVTIDNALFEDRTLSWKAKGILGYLLTKPNGWKVILKDIINHSTDGESSVKSGLKELKTKGYLAYRRIRKKGKFVGIVWEYDDIPFVIPKEEQTIDIQGNEPQGDFPLVDFPPVENHPDISNTNLSNTYFNKYINNSYIDYIDDDKRAFAHQEEKIDLIISTLREATKDELSERSFKSVVKKVVDKYIQGKVNSFRDYLVTALIGKIEELDIRRQKEKGMEQAKKLRDHSRLKKLEPSEDIPIYNWLA